MSKPTTIRIGDADRATLSAAGRGKMSAGLREVLEVWRDHRASRLMVDRELAEAAETETSKPEPRE